MIKGEVKIKRRDGSDFTHTASLVGYEQTANGSLVYRTACCGKVGALIACPQCGGTGTVAAQTCSKCRGIGRVKDDDTTERHTLDAVGAMSDQAILDHVQAAVNRAAQGHADNERSFSFLDLHLPLQQ